MNLLLIFSPRLSSPRSTPSSLSWLHRLSSRRAVSLLAVSSTCALRSIWTRVAPFTAERYLLLSCVTFHVC